MCDFHADTMRVLHTSNGGVHVHVDFFELGDGEEHSAVTGTVEAYVSPEHGGSLTERAIHAAHLSVDRARALGVTVSDDTDIEAHLDVVTDWKAFTGSRETEDVIAAVARSFGWDHVVKYRQELWEERVVSIGEKR